MTYNAHGYHIYSKTTDYIVNLKILIPLDSIEKTAQV